MTLRCLNSSGNKGASFYPKLTCAYGNKLKKKKIFQFLLVKSVIIDLDRGMKELSETFNPL